MTRGWPFDFPQSQRVAPERRGGGPSISLWANGRSGNDGLGVGRGPWGLEHAGEDFFAVGLA